MRAAIKYDFLEMDKFLSKRPRLQVEVLQEQQDNGRPIQNQVAAAIEVDIVPSSLPQCNSCQLQHVASVSNATKTNRPGTGKQKCLHINKIRLHIIIK